VGVVCVCVRWRLNFRKVKKNEREIKRKERKDDNRRVAAAARARRTTLSLCVCVCVCVTNTNIGRFFDRVPKERKRSLLDKYSNQRQRSRAPVRFSTNKTHSQHTDRPVIVCVCVCRYLLKNKRADTTANSDEKKTVFRCRVLQHGKYCNRCVHEQPLVVVFYLQTYTQTGVSRVYIYISTYLIYIGIYTR